MIRDLDARSQVVHIIAVSLASEAGKMFSRLQPFDKDCYLRSAELITQQIEKHIGAET